MDDGNLALFCDFENVALGVEEIGSGKFDIGVVLERLLLKGSIVVKKAYCDWSRYDKFRPAMHEAAFELIEIPHVRQSGKNSADIRMVVDALDLCYTKEHIDTFVIISGDSDFSPLVSKLRENAKTVIGVGVKNSTSDLLAKSCDEFIFYDDLIASTRKRKRGTPKRKATKAKTAPKKSQTKDVAESDTAIEGIELVLATAEDLLSERGDRGVLWGSMVKQTLKRREPGFSESRYGFSSFSELLEQAQDQGLIDIELDEKAGGYIIRKIH